MTTYRSPDVYVEEISVFPPSVAEVETAIPAFIGYTEKAKKNADKDLILKPTKIYSLKDYERYYGYPKDDKVSVSVSGDDTKGYSVDSVSEPEVKYTMYYNLKMFFDNGGGQCYIISVGTYQDQAVIALKGEEGEGADAGTKYGLEDGLDVLELEDEPTLIVIPEAVNLSEQEYASLVKKVLTQCSKLRDRFAIFDIYGGSEDLDTEKIQEKRVHFGTEYLKYGAAYYPYIKTTMNYHVSDKEDNIDVIVGEEEPHNLSSFKSAKTSIYNSVKMALKEYFVVLPPSAAVAGIYAATDSNHGVWKAPANVGLKSVIEPMVKINNTKQGFLNYDSSSGRSINAIRSFSGKGTMVWGARTLAGNDNEWRYVPVRRLFNMVEESVKKSTSWAVFEPNDANTWVKVRGSIENYLIQKWREGALAGATPKQAFFVKCGLGVTMTAQHILEGTMNVEIGMAAVRPAEFIVLKFSHKLQTA